MKELRKQIDRMFWEHLWICLGMSMLVSAVGWIWSVPEQILGELLIGNTSVFIGILIFDLRLLPKLYRAHLREIDQKWEIQKDVIDRIEKGLQKKIEEQERMKDVHGSED